MAYTWGSTTLKIVPESYSPAHSTNGITEIQILPSGTAEPSSVIQQAGRGRKRIRFNAFVSSLSEYETLHADYIALTERSFSDGTNSMTAIIEELSPATMITPSKFDFSVTLIEV